MPQAVRALALIAAVTAAAACSWPDDTDADEALDGCRKVSVRGAPGAFYSGDLDLYVGNQTVVIFADSRARALRAAEALRTVDAERATGRDLPAPTIDPEPGLARCS
ncbi:MAG: hypothetical protein ACRDLZ_04495 [Gaiellaceae bacterium]